MSTRPEPHGLKGRARGLAGRRPVAAQAVPGGDASRMAPASSTDTGTAVAAIRRCGTYASRSHCWNFCTGVPCTVIEPCVEGRVREGTQQRGLSRNRSAEQDNEFTGRDGEVRPCAYGGAVEVDAIRRTSNGADSDVPGPVRGVHAGPCAALPLDHFGEVGAHDRKVVLVDPSSRPSSGSRVRWWHGLLAMVWATFGGSTRSRSRSWSRLAVPLDEVGSSASRLGLGVLPRGTGR